MLVKPRRNCIVRRPLFGSSSVGTTTRLSDRLFGWASLLPDNYFNNR